MSSIVKWRGLSLVEVLVALVVLAVGVLGAAQLQASSLRASSAGERIQDATVIARAELEHRLQMVLTPNPSANCLASIPEEYDCTVVVRRCTIVGGALTCSGVDESDALGFEIAVTATGPRGESATLRSFAGSLVGAGGDTVVDDDGEDESNGEPGEGDDDNGDAGGGDGGDDDDGGGGDEGGDDGGDGGPGGPGGGGGPPVCVPPRFC